MANRKVKWCKPSEDKAGNLVRVSKCDGFRIVTKAMASGRNGFFNQRAYAPERADGTLIGRSCDSLVEAQDAVELDNDPNWEPS